MTKEPMTAERLIKVADDAAAVYRDAFMPPYIEASRKCLEAFKQASDEGMDHDIAAVALQRFFKKIDEATADLDTALTELGKQYGLD